MTPAGGGVTLTIRRCRSPVYGDAARYHLRTVLPSRMGVRPFDRRFMIWDAEIP
jgi:hypothetical protein